MQTENGIDRPAAHVRPFLRRVLVLSSGSSAAQAAVMLSAPLVTRLFAPADFGNYAVALAVIAIIGTAACLRYDIGVVLPRSESQAINLLVLSLTTAIAVALISYLIIGAYIVFREHADPLRIPSSLLLLIPVGIFLAGVQSALRSWAVRGAAFKKIAIATIVQSLTMVVVQIGLGAMFGSSALILLVGSLSGAAAGAVILCHGLPSASSIFKVSSFLRIRTGALRHLNLPLYRAPYSLVGQIGDRGLVLVMSSLSSKSEVGAVALALRIIFVPLAILSGSIEQVFYNHAATNPKSADLEDFFASVLLTMTIIFSPLFFFAAFHMHFIFSTVFGEEWADAGTYASWLSVAGLSMLLTNWTSRLFDISSTQRVSFLIETLYVCTSILLVVCTLLLSRSTLVAVYAYSLWRIVYSLVWLYASIKVMEFSLVTFWRFILYLAGVCVYCVAIDISVTYLASSGALQAVLVVLACVLPIILGMRAWADEHRELRSVL